MVVGHAGIYAGGAHQALYAIRGLRRAGLEVGAIWGPDAESDRGGFKGLKELQIPFWIIPIHRRITINSIIAVRKVMNQFRPDVVEAVKSGAQYHTLAAGIALKAGLVFYRGISRPLEWGQSLKYRLRRVNRIIVNCPALKETMVKSGRIAPGKIDVIPSEFDPSCADPAKVDATGLRGELGIPVGVPLVAQLGNHAEWRGQEVTLEAAAMLQRNGLRFHLLFAGRETEKLLPTVRRLGLEKVVTLSRYRRDPERILKECDVIVNASTENESLSGALLNGQAMGVPAVTSALSGNALAVEDGVTGFVTPIGDAGALAEAVGTIIQLPPPDYLRWRRAARDRALRLFSSEQRAKLRIECYQKALKDEG